MSGDLLDPLNKCAKLDFLTQCVLWVMESCFMRQEAEAEMGNPRLTSGGECLKPG